ncbi:dihydrodipicolinate synthase family protein [Saccharibacillus sp. CPCC 101409]|uniref:dihydrodipicolinate synthase family protein n=1 Tax=Saccharibacillus sp. CPCC 101409 TaxID=3058041 RepID=UPI002673B4CC|nr:dihydrodipicolinate synthase family protein [Saccharibacillus sp. CPCC 101409]MDO3412461.1 dihydrodipicolinate synthase family protein [Saccharibacillus sp. CPCC 101409]
MRSEPAVSGIWPTMLTPFVRGGQVDWSSLERLVEWYIAQGAHGLFAVCQSSEMFRLTLEERVGIASFVRQKARGRVPVIASGHTGGSFGEQVGELRAMASTGVDALVLITNRLAEQGESEAKAIDRLQRLLDELPADLPLGFYECPFPYKRLLSDELLSFSVETGRFRFIKDTCCDADTIRRRLKLLEGTGVKLFNANSATLLDSLRSGAAGYSGVMANFHPSLYVRLWNEYESDPAGAELLAAFLTTASLIEKQSYPANAKYNLLLEGILESAACRVLPDDALSATHRSEVEQLRLLTDAWYEEFGKGRYE